MEVAAEDGFLRRLRLGFGAHRLPNGRLVERLAGAIAVQQRIGRQFYCVAHAGPLVFRGLCESHTLG